jgi:hypothetical protein
MLPSTSLSGANSQTRPASGRHQVIPSALEFPRIDEHLMKHHLVSAAPATTLGRTARHRAGAANMSSVASGRGRSVGSRVLSGPSAASARGSHPYGQARRLCPRSSASARTTQGARLRRGTGHQPVGLAISARPAPTGDRERGGTRNAHHAPWRALRRRRASRWLERRDATSCHDLVGRRRPPPAPGVHVGGHPMIACENLA